MRRRGMRGARAILANGGRRSAVGDSMTASASQTVRRREGTATGSGAVAGFATPGFEAVREAFIENFERRKELGAACCVYYRGEKVVDLWGGIRNKATGEPWEEDTMALVYSTTKGNRRPGDGACPFAGAVRLRRAREHLLAGVRPTGQGTITVRQLLSHQAGLFALDDAPGQEHSSRIPTGWLPSWRGRNQLGRRAPARPIMQSPSAFMRASCCVGGSRAPKPGPVLPGGNRNSPGTRLLYPAAEDDPGLQTGAA